MGHWRFDEGSGTTAYDSSGYGNHGSLTNAPTWTTLSSGYKALNFDGSDDYMRTTAFSIPNSEILSILVWVN